ncbi:MULTISPECIES: sodium/glutamate symporter [Brevibacterium]|jgi:ESS family glutamate:Na+ symporter|uniref:Sodium:glutamate symporter n=1 Tax=Brevibacterium sediminis TaxID=1857024 RepID=A0ABQ1N0W9_9MICO|nr:sodium:glutamate symporter [Brevibacterium sediminis]MCS4593307.1 sodium:glutamate symporter [Brevibacterium sediminis]GGC50487.1 sodium:glutamate symporter [Brevibacterium sediminis]
MEPTEFSPSALLVDAGLIGGLLVIGTILRAKISAIQTMMIPAGVIAGVLGLVLGPNVLGWLPFSDQLGEYTSLLIVLVFACLAMTSDFNILKIGRSVAGFASYGVLIYAAQTAIGMGLVLLVLGPLFGAPDHVGLLLFAGWAGGFGSAAAIGTVFADSGDPAVQSLAFTAATVGLLVGVVGGIIQAKYGAVKGYAREFSGLDKVPAELRTGILDDNVEQPAIGTHKFSGSAIESLTFQAGIVAGVSAGAYGINVILGELIPSVAFPLFSIAFLVGLVLRALLSATSTTKFIDKDTQSSISGSATDVLMVCGIASVVPSFVVDQWLSLLILFVVGLALCLFLGLWVAPRVMEEGWFERQLFTWGWATGAVATGIALLRIVDPKLNSRTLEDFSLAYLPVIPVEVTAVTFAPLLVIAGASWAVVGIWGAITVVAVAAAFVVVAGNRRSRIQV